MELEEMQAAWKQMSAELETQKRLTDDIIMKMTKERYTKQWNSIGIAESIGTIISFSAAIALVVYFYKLDTILLQLCGFLCLTMLVVAPIFSLKSIYEIRNVSMTVPYNQMMRNYAKAKKQFISFQKFNMIGSFFFMLLTIPVTGKIFNNEDLFETLDLKLLIALPFCFVFFYLLIRHVSKSYKKVLRNSEALLQELEERD